MEILLSKMEKSTVVCHSELIHHSQPGLFNHLISADDSKFNDRPS